MLSLAIPRAIARSLSSARSKCTASTEIYIRLNAFRSCEAFVIQRVPAYFSWSFVRVAPDLWILLWSVLPSSSVSS